MASAASRKLLRELPSKQEMTEILLDLKKHGGDATAILGAAYIEHTLTSLLQVSFRELNSEERNRMFDWAQNAILGTFSAKIRISYAVRLIEKEIYDDLLMINEIRNVFAHSLHKVTFNNDLVAVDCRKLTAVSRAAKRGWIAKDHTITNAIDIFSHTILLLHLELKEEANRFLVTKELMRGS